MVVKHSTKKHAVQKKSPSEKLAKKLVSKTKKISKTQEVVEETTGRRETEILYLDDRAENVNAGKARGWRVILQESPDKSWAAVRKTGLLN